MISQTTAAARQPHMAFIDPIDRDNFEPGTPPSEDFYRHVNGGWLDANPVPPQYPAWGASYEVHVRNEMILHDLLEGATDHGWHGLGVRQ